MINMSVVPVPATPGAVPGVTFPTSSRQTAGETVAVQSQADFTSLFAELLGFMRTGREEGFVPGLVVPGDSEPTGESPGGEPAQASEVAAASPNPASAAFPAQAPSPIMPVTIPIRVETGAQGSDVPVPGPDAAAAVPGYTWDASVTGGPDDSASMPGQALPAKAGADPSQAVARHWPEHSSEPRATVDAEQPKSRDIARGDAAPAAAVDSTLGTVPEPADSMGDATTRPRPTQVASVVSQPADHGRKGEVQTAPAPADFSWMMTDPVRQVRQSTLLGPAPVPIPLEALDVTDKPVLESAPSEVVLLQADAGAGANTRTDAVSRAETPRQTPEVHQRVIDQLVKEIKLVKLQDGSDLMVRLQPPELGSLRIHLVSDAQGVTSQIEASNPQVRSLLQAHMPMLMDALSTAGVRLDSVSVTAAMSLGAWSDNAAQQHSQQQTGTPRHRHGAGGLDPAMLSGEPAAAYGLQESAAFSWLA